MAQPTFFLQPLAAAISLACFSSVVFAAEADSAHILAPIVVTAQQGNDAHGLIVHADPKQPTQPIPAVDGAAYLQSIVGFNQIKNGGANGDVTFRGMFGSRIKILTDGTENLGACPGRMDNPASYVSPESYDKITVVKGPQTVQYAHTGSAATVIFEREPEQLTSAKPYRGQASAMLGSYGRLDQNVEAAVGDETKYARLNANRSIADSYQDGAGNTVPSDWEKWNADLALGWTPNEDTWIELKGGKSDGEAVYAGRSMDGSKFARESLGLHVEKKNIGEVIKKVEAQVDYSYNDHVMDNFSLRKFNPADGMSMPMASNVARRTLNARVAMTQDWGKLQLISGIDSQKNEHTKRSGSLMSPYQNKARVGDMDFESYGAFGELSYAFNDQHKLVTGARLDQAKIDNLATDTERKETLPSGFIRIESELAEHVKTYAGLGYVERVPDYWELFSTKYHQSTGTTFADLENEKTAQFDAGYQYEQGAFKSWASVYAGLIQDYILVKYVPVISMGKTKYEARSRNVDATIAGAEVGVAYQLTDQIQADISAMYAWGENTTDHTALPQIAPLEGRFNLRYVQEKYNLGLLWRVVAAQDRTSYREGNIIGYDLEDSKSFGTLSLNGTYNIQKDLDLSVGIDNVLNKNYAEHLNKLGSSGFDYAATEQFNNIGRNYWARISMKF
ncbi:MULTISPECIES: TonB-dependent copper receptor [Acinetobacter]|uniref:TonB-dependent copper receptor n=4 Tax=Acinetobacter TaxID=469 RepID=A0AAJ6II46_ACIJO|nr:TonB-dependent copper receptor [Acinetobacter johnsonii]MBK5645925.1 TonB-dependent copper receptor [Acinetobacter sp.]ALV74243.1 TonB-dependent receptor [Acinetobacter johnsonii XBB1]MBL4859785.1 TonB-dependent copper receptor [Acinetobacter sp.]MCV2452036.1 TonB-dependent copper receptor [Acinetobacter johnsonii]MDH1241288.1 TonB-dependent copper receptor [Acinetobacter johnsonii]